MGKLNLSMFRPDQEITSAPSLASAAMRGFDQGLARGQAIGSQIAQSMEAGRQEQEAARQEQEAARARQMALMGEVEGGAPAGSRGAGSRRVTGSGRAGASDTDLYLLSQGANALTNPMGAELDYADRARAKAEAMRLLAQRESELASAQEGAQRGMVDRMLYGSDQVSGLLPAVDQWSTRTPDEISAMANRAATEDLLRRSVAPPVPPIGGEPLPEVVGADEQGLAMAQHRNRTLGVIDARIEADQDLMAKNKALLRVVTDPHRRHDLLWELTHARQRVGGLQKERRQVERDYRTRVGQLQGDGTQVVAPAPGTAPDYQPPATDYLMDIERDPKAKAEAYRAATALGELPEGPESQVQQVGEFSEWLGKVTEDRLQALQDAGVDPESIASLRALRDEARASVEADDTVANPAVKYGLPAEHRFDVGRLTRAKNYARVYGDQSAWDMLTNGAPLDSADRLIADVMRYDNAVETAVLEAQKEPATNVLRAKALDAKIKAQDKFESLDAFTPEAISKLIRASYADDVISDETLGVMAELISNSKEPSLAFQRFTREAGNAMAQRRRVDLTRIRAEEARKTKSTPSGTTVADRNPQYVRLNVMRDNLSSDIKVLEKQIADREYNGLEDDPDELMRVRRELRDKRDERDSVDEQMADILENQPATTTTYTTTTTTTPTNKKLSDGVYVAPDGTNYDVVRGKVFTLNGDPVDGVDMATLKAK